MLQIQLESILLHCCSMSVQDIFSINEMLSNNLKQFILTNVYTVNDITQYLIMLVF